MQVTELNKNQLEELKQKYYSEKMGAQGEGVSYGELIEIDNLVSDSEIFKEYEGIDFSECDFFSSCENCNQCMSSYLDGDTLTITFNHNHDRYITFNVCALSKEVVENWKKDTTQNKDYLTEYIANYVLDKFGSCGIDGVATKWNNIDFELDKTQEIRVENSLIETLDDLVLQEV